MKRFGDLLHAKPQVAAHLKSDFAAFCRAAWPVLHPGAKLSWTAAHDCVADYLTAVATGKIRRLIINIVPRSGKSSIASVCFPVWVWLNDPRRDFLCCSYEIDLSENFNLARRRLIESPWFRDLFGEELQLSTDRAQAQEFSNTAGGVMQAASTNSKAMGRGGDFIICDDPLSGDVAYSDILRNEVNFWFEHQLPQRLNNPSESAIVVVMQRLHQNDPTGFLLSQQDSEWELLKLPLIAEENETIVLPHSGRVWKRKKGDCLDPKRWNSRTVRERQRNRLVWASQFQQNPVPIEGNLIRANEILFWGGRDPQTGISDPGLPEFFDRKIISVDCAFKDLRTSDYVGVIVVGIVGARRYLLHVTNAHLDLAATIREVKNLHAVNSPVSATLVEDAANGAAVTAALRDQLPGLVPVSAQGGKMARLAATAPEFQAGNWIVERHGPWTHEVIAQLTTFPRAKHDDLVDAISQASVWLQENSTELGFLEVLKKTAKEIFAGVRNSAGELLQRKSAANPKKTEQEQQLVQASNFREWLDRKKAPPCPLCGSASTVYVAGPKLHCNQCGADNGARVETEIIVGKNCCGAPLAQQIASFVRCGNCGKQSNEPVIHGVGFAQLEQLRRGGRYR